MRFSAVAKILGIFLMIFSLSMLPPILVSLIYEDGAEFSFVAAFLITFFVGFLFWFSCRRYKHELKIRDGFLVVTLFWVVLSVFATIPLMLIYYPNLSFTNAMFESVSGLTTTGATVLTNLDQLPRSILYYRQQLHLLGGMGIIVLAVAVLPMLGIGGMQLYRAETVGPMKTAKLRPRMTETAKALWYIYVGLVVICALSYWLAGMKILDAIGESFSTISTGGFTMHDSSFAYYQSKLINWIALFFMIAGATNFALHFGLIRQRSFKVYFNDPEFRSFIVLMFFASVIIAACLILADQYDYGVAMMNSVFTIVSVASTTGFTDSNFNLWPTFIPYMIMFIALIGGCGGSTSGGIKIMRVLMLKEQGKRELKRLVHPQAVVSIKYGKEVLPDQIVQSIWGFVAVFVALFVVLFLILLSTGLDVRTVFGALSSCISNVGASIGNVDKTYAGLPSDAKWILIFAMIAGRLEVFTILVLFTRNYWKK